MNDITIALALFVVSYIVIVSEKVDRMVVAILGAMAMIIFLSDYKQSIAFHAVDLNVIFLLMGMMVIANLLSETGVFQWLAVKAVHIGKGNPVRVMQILAVITAAGSALLDNVTVVVLIAPITIFVASTLKTNPIPLLIAEILASNIGGAATLIGDPPNILIGSAAGLDFATFAANMTPLVIISMALFIVILPWIMRRRVPDIKDVPPDQLGLSSEGLITNPVLLRQSLIVLALVMAGFMLHGLLHLQTATIALTGAGILLLWTRRDPHQALRDVEWPTLMFFVGLFILVEALVHVGAIEIAAKALFRLTKGNLPVTTLSLLWLSGIASGVIDNIPFTATLIPIVKELGTAGMDTRPLWWALAIGADFGGNSTLVGASANLVVASFAARSGYHISFMRFARYGILTSFITLLLGSVHLWLFYLL